jgi:hypothetical protein
MPTLGTVDINVPMGTHYLNKYRRVWCKVIPQLYGGLVYYDLTYKQPLSLSGMTDQTVSGWRRINRLGQFGCLQFDGVDDRASGLAGASMTNNYTLAATVYIDTTSNKGCFIKAGDTNQGFGIGIGSSNYDSPGNDLIALIESVRWQTLKAAVGTGWNRIVASISSGGAIVAYINGVQVYSEASGTGANAPGSFNFYVGGYTSTAGSTTPRYFRGLVDNAVLYNKVLTAADVKEDWRLEQVGFIDALNFVKRKPYLYLLKNPLESFSASLNFRASKGYVADQAGETVVLGDQYPSRGNYVTYGWVSNTRITGLDRNAAAPYAPELSGLNYTTNATGGVEFRVDLPAAGTYAVRLAIGDPAFAQIGQYVSICDGVNGPILATVATGQTAAGFIDATGVTRAGPDVWKASNEPVQVVTSGPVLTIRIGDSPDGNNTCLSHLEIRSVTTLAPVGITAGATWNVHGKAGATYTSSWHDRARVSSPGSAGWNVRQTVGASGQESWDIRQNISINVNTQWDVRAAVGLTETAVWDVYVPAGVTSYPVGITINSSWNVLVAVSVNGMASWNVSTLAGLAGAASWDNCQPVGLEGSVVWANMVSVGTVRSATWDVRTPSRIAGNALWHVRRRVGGGYADHWHNRVLAGLERSAQWSLRGRVGQSYSALWGISTLLAHWPVGLNVSLVWGDRRRLRLDALATWNDRLVRGMTRGLMFNTHTRSGLNSSIRFHTRSRVGTTWIATWRDRELRRVTYQDRWNIRSIARLAAAGVWGTRARVGLIRSASWIIRVPVSMSLSGTWRNRSRVAVGGACVWGLRARVGSNQHTYWDVHDLSGISADAFWSLRSLATYEGSVRFTTFLATRPDGIAFNPADAATYIESQHGLNPWGLIPAVGSVRIDHDYPKPDAMRATRGHGADGIPGVNIRIFEMNDYQSGLRQDPRDVQGRSVTGPDGRWLNDIYLIPGEYIILYEEAARFPVADYLVVVGSVPGREPPELPPGDINNPYYELDYNLSVAHGWGMWGPGQLRGPSPVDHNFTGTDRYQFTRNGVGFPGVTIEIFPEADYHAGRTGDRYRVGWSRTNAAGRWDWPVNLYPGRYVAVGWHLGIATLFDIEVS